MAVGVCGIFHKKNSQAPVLASFVYKGFCYLLHLIDDGLESIEVVHGEVGKCLAVDLDACLVDGAHQLAVRHTFETSGCVDTLNPKGTELTLLQLTAYVSIGESLLIGVFGNGPHVLAGTKLTLDALQNLLSSCT